MNSKSFFPQKFERDILRAACIIGSLRMVAAIYRDLTEAFQQVDFIIDMSLLVIVLIPLILTYTSLKLEYYLIPFCFLIALAMPFSWISSGGLDSNNEHQIIGAIFLFTMILNGRWLIFFNCLMIVMELSLIHIWNNHQDMISGLLKEPSMESIHFILMAVSVTAAVLYLKHKLCLKRDFLNQQRDTLSIKLQELSDQTDLIRKQKRELEAINHSLEQKVELRSSQLNRHNDSLKHFLELSLRDINTPLNSILESIANITDLNDNYDMIKLLADSGIELEQSVKEVAQRLETDVVNLNQEKL